MAYTPEKALFFLQPARDDTLIQGDHIFRSTSSVVLTNTGTGINFNLTTPYTTTPNVDSVGRFTLTPNKKYLISFSHTGSFGGVNHYCYIYLYNADTNTQIGDQWCPLYAQGSTSNLANSTGYSHFLVTAGSNRYELKISTLSGTYSQVSNAIAQASFLKIQEL